MDPHGNYRSDIDGLRAVAVSSVVLYHYGLPGLSGGFVGVDVFFVISGFLIGQIVFGQLQARKFSFQTFYLRRVRRLFPAAMAMTFVTSALAYWLFLPKDFREFGQSVVASTLYASNVLFYLKAGYFDTASHMKPLLHTWSLAVEEQFYIVFPLVAWLCHRHCKRFVVATFLLALLLSFAAAVWYMAHDQRAAFYLYPFRAWELFIGTVLSLTTERWTRVVRSVPMANLMGMAGLLGTIGSVAWYTNTTVFPAQGAILPCVSAALVIVAGFNQQSLASRILSTAPMVLIGRMSYSIYLWHWPLLVLYSYAKVDELSTLDKSMLLLGTLAISAATWRFVEEPIRSGRFTWTRRSPWVLGWSAAASVLFMVAGLYVYKTDGMPSRLDTETARLAAVDSDFFQDWSDCVAASDARVPGLAYCATGSPAQMRDMVIVWGDSHAAALKNGFLALARERQRDALLFWNAGCPPVLGVNKRESSSTADADKSCPRHNDAIMTFLGQNRHRISSVILVGRWAYYANGIGLGSDAHNTVTLSQTDSAAPAGRSQSELLTSALDRTIDALRSYDLDVFVLEQLPEFANFSSSKLARQLRNGSADYANSIARLTSEDERKVRHRQSVMANFLDRLVGERRANVLRSHSAFCAGGMCSMLSDGIPSYFDNNHVTATSAVRLRNLFAPAIPALTQQAAR